MTYKSKITGTKTSISILVIDTLKTFWTDWPFIHRAFQTWIYFSCSGQGQILLFRLLLFGIVRNLDDQKWNKRVEYDVRKDQAEGGPGVGSRIDSSKLKVGSLSKCLKMMPQNMSIFIQMLVTFLNFRRLRRKKWVDFGHPLWVGYWPLFYPWMKHNIGNITRDK